MVLSLTNLHRANQLANPNFILNGDIILFAFFILPTPIFPMLLSMTSLLYFTVFLALSANIWHSLHALEKSLILVNFSLPVYNMKGIKMVTISQT